LGAVTPFVELVRGELLCGDGGHAVGSLPGPVPDDLTHCLLTVWLHPSAFRSSNPLPALSHHHSAGRRGFLPQCLSTTYCCSTRRANQRRLLFPAPRPPSNRRPSGAP